MDLSTLREQFEPHLRGFLIKKETAAQTYVTNPLLAEWLLEPARLMTAGGKRVRPLLCLLGYLAAGGTLNPALFQAASSLELFHLFALIHDDIMDHGRERHGVPTAHRQIAERLQALGRRGDAVHVGVSQAIIIGDLLFSWSIEALSTAELPSGAIQRAKEVFFRMSDEVMVGQMLDVDLTTRTESSFEEIIAKMCLKTAGYTFIKPFQLGVALAEGEESLMHFAESFGRHVGIAFQIQDDIHDAFAATEQTGKTPLCDICDHQHSLLTQRLLEVGSEEDKEALQLIWGKQNIEAEAYERLRLAFYRSGALAFAQQSCLTHLHAAQVLLKEVMLPEDVRMMLEQLLAKAVSVSWLDALEQTTSERYGTR